MEFVFATVFLLGMLCGVFLGFSVRVKLTYHYYAEDFPDPDAIVHDDEPIPYSVRDQDDTGSWKDSA